MAERDRISRIETLWSVVLRAHGPDSAECQSAQRELLHRYGFAIRRYLQAALRDESAADDVFQEFAVALVRGDYHRADPQRGKFRSFLKTILFRLVADFRRQQYRRESPAGSQPQAEIAVADEGSAMDEQFLALWRESLLGKTWARLEEAESESGKPYFSVLRCRVDHPQAGSSDLAEKLTEKLGKPVSAANARVLIHRARDKFGNLLLDEILPSLNEPTPDRLEEELIDLGLMEYCRGVFQRRRQAGEE